MRLFLTMPWKRAKDITYELRVNEITSQPCKNIKFAQHLWVPMVLSFEPNSVGNIDGTTVNDQTFDQCYQSRSMFPVGAIPKPHHGTGILHTLGWF